MNCVFDHLLTPVGISFGTKYHNDSNLSHINYCLSPYHLIFPIFIANTEANKAVQQKTIELKNALAGTFAAAAIGASVLSNPLPADAASTMADFPFSSSNVIAEKVVRQGLYSDYEVEINQEVDDARSTFKSAKETKSKKGKFRKMKKKDKNYCRDGFYWIIEKMNDSITTFCYYLVPDSIPFFFFFFFFSVRNRQIHCYLGDSGCWIVHCSYGTILLVR